MRIGFTGSRQGMTEHQRLRVTDWLIAHREQITSLVYGDCIGADAQAFQLVKDLIPTARTIAYPSNLSKFQAHTPADVVHEPMSPLARNWRVAEVDVLLACPGSSREDRSGSWSTVRRARALGTSIEVFEP